MKKQPVIHDVHTRHCCILHGCKYGKDDTCTVMTGAAPQEHVCETCDTMDGIHDLKTLMTVLKKKKKKRCFYCGHIL